MTTEVAARSGAPFVGRERELRELEAALQDAVAGRGGVVLLAGEPGIGKSRLADQFARHAEDAGALVLAGRCWEAGGAPPYWPWVQALRSYVRTQEAAALEQLLGNGASDVAQIVPAIRDVLPDVPEPPSLDPESARFRLFQAVCDLLRRVSVDTPVVLMLEDVQSADTPSLLMLRFAAPELSASRTLVLATYRTTEIESSPALAEAVADVSRVPTSRRILLKGLPDTDVRTLIDAAAGAPLAPELSRAISDAAEGNPLFALEIVRLLAAENRLDGATGAALLAIPQGVRDVIGRRLLRLSDDCTNVLTMAAVLGRDFGVEPLRRLSGRNAEDILGVLQEALAARVVTDHRGTIGALRFSHALIREALYDDLSPTQRVRLHRAAGGVLEDLYADSLDAHLGELAHHFSRAAPAGDAAKAVRYARAAADQALARLAYEEAVRLYELALQALDLEPPVDQARRAELLASLGDAQARAGELHLARSSFLDAATIARTHRLPETLARAALGYGGRFVWGRGSSDPNIVPLLVDARGALAGRDDPLMVRVTGRLACALRSEPDRGPRERLAREAVAMARRIGDPSTTAYALEALWGAIWDPSSLDERLALIPEIERWSELARDRERALGAEQARRMAALEQGDLEAARSDRRRGAESQPAEPAHRWFGEAVTFLIEFVEGRLDDAERTMEAARREGLSSASWDAEGAYAMHRFMLAWHRGRLDAELPLLENAARGYGDVYHMFRAALGLSYAASGHPDRAREILARYASDRFAGVPFDNEWILTMSLFSHLAVTLGDTVAAETLYERLRPFADRAVFGAAEGLLGSMERVVGILAAAIGNLEDAVARLERAIDFEVRTGAHACAAWSRSALAEVLHRRGSPGDADRAALLAEQAREFADSAGMRALSARLDGLGVDRSPGSGAPGPSRPATLRREGEYWAVSFDGDAFRLKHSKGLEYLATLLSEPGRERHVLDLVAGGATRTAGTTEELGGMDAGAGAGPVLDARAKEAYRRRLDDLEADIDEAERTGDTVRASRSRDERDAIASELAAAVGLGGRDRPTASAAERARLNVTRALRSAMARIGEHSAPLGTHLDRSVRTGTFCVYLPDPRSGVVWRI